MNTHTHLVRLLCVATPLASPSHAYRNNESFKSVFMLLKVLKGSPPAGHSHITLYFIYIILYYTSLKCKIEQKNMKTEPYASS